ncbi:hypothetical protein BDEG_22829 [Batrachochytrium dendrobatidis JEL423]|uniref:Myb/SANT-like domain-containing protein n=1 Tax=Batrachochytrium dendrobatidis (strain JEL423) TaxID=403673 RepID=A0A177WFR7_BATDL|nr:hypothetical protein BDEG_22829 [Batrachochytrium dendrobatidis JEL423]
MAGDKKPASWDETQRWALVHCALNQLQVGERLEGSFKSSEWDRIAQDFAAITHKSYIKQQLQTQLAILKRAYRVVHALRTEPRFLWVDGLPTASEDTIQQYLAEHPEATPYITMRFPLYDDLHQLLHKKLPPQDLLGVDMDNQRLVVAAAAAAAAAADMQLPGSIFRSEKGKINGSNSGTIDTSTNTTHSNNSEDDDDEVDLSDYINGSPTSAHKTRSLTAAAAAAAMASSAALSSAGKRHAAPSLSRSSSIRNPSKRSKAAVAIPTSITPPPPASTAAAASLLMDSWAAIAGQQALPNFSRDHFALDSTQLAIKAFVDAYGPEYSVEQRLDYATHLRDDAADAKMFLVMDDDCRKLMLTRFFQQT